MQKSVDLDRVDVVYDSAQVSHPLVEEIKAVFQYRELVRQFVSRTLKTRYKRSFLGIVWTLLNPLLTMLVLTLVFSAVFRLTVDHYPVYILSGLTAWLFFSSSTQAAMGEMVWSGELLHRIYVPKSIFVVSAVSTSLVNLFISLVPLFLISLALGLPMHRTILVMPFAILLLTMFALGMGLLLATAAIYFADMLPVYEVLLTLWMYSTPIIYPITAIPAELRGFFLLNPMYYFLMLFRQPLFEGKIPDWQTWAIGGMIAVFTLVVGGLVFTARSKEYAFRV